MNRDCDGEDLFLLPNLFSKNTVLKPLSKSPLRSSPSSGLPVLLPRARVRRRRRGRPSQPPVPPPRAAEERRKRDIAGRRGGHPGVQDDQRGADAAGKEPFTTMYRTPQAFCESGSKFSNLHFSDSISPKNSDLKNPRESCRVKLVPFVPFVSQKTHFPWTIVRVIWCTIVLIFSRI